MSSAVTIQRVFQGFTDPVFDGQKVFRTALTAMSRPGMIMEIPVRPPAPEPLHPAAVALALTLCDLDTPLWLDQALDVDPIRDYLAFQCGSRFTQRPDRAAFALIGRGESLSGLSEFSQGEPAYPDRSTTLIIQVQAFGRGQSREFSGPGIKGRVRFSVEGLHPSFWSDFARNHDRFPLGVDCILASPAEICGLPRTAKIED